MIQKEEGGKNWSKGTDPKMTEMTQLTNKDYKTAIIMRRHMED